MLPLMLLLYTGRLGEAGAPLRPRITSEIDNHFGWLDSQLAGREWFVGSSLSAADIQLSFAIQACNRMYGIDKFPNLTKEEMQKVFDNLKTYRDHARVIALTYGDLISLFVSGEVVALFCGWSGIPVETGKQGVVTQYAIPTEGAVMWCDAWFTPISVDNSDTAHDFINLAVDPAAQAQTAKAVTAGAVNRKALDHMDDATKALFDYSNLDAVFKAAPLYGIPPRESDTYATYSDWVDAWNEFKVG